MLAEWTSDRVAVYLLALAFTKDLALPIKTYPLPIRESFLGTDQVFRFFYRYV